MNIITSFFSAVLLFLPAIAGASPSPLSQPLTSFETGKSLEQLVQRGRGGMRSGGHRARPATRPGNRPVHRPGHRPGDRPGHRPGHRPGNRPGHGYHHGHRGYRYYGGVRMLWWVPGMALIAGTRCYVDGYGSGVIRGNCCRIGSRCLSNFYIAE